MFSALQSKFGLAPRGYGNSSFRFFEIMETITINTLFNTNNIPYDKYDFINLDIQGAELLALQGATQILPHIKAIYTEVNEKELYENCALLPDLEKFLSDNGFVRAIVIMTPAGWGDGLYIRI